jgi:hypothetical protein
MHTNSIGDAMIVTKHTTSVEPAATTDLAQRPTAWWHNSIVGRIHTWT